MTQQNAKKLYKHFKEIGNSNALKDILRRYPEFEEKPKSKPKSKSKGSDK